MIIYKATNKINNKIYIGQTIHTLNYRRKQHENSINTKHAQNRVFCKAIKKYGKENFEWEILEEAKTQKELNSLEIKYIKELNSLIDYGCGYNTDKGGSHGKHSEYTKEKISKGLKSSENLYIAYGKDHGYSKKVIEINSGIKFDCIKEAAEYFNVNHSKVTAVCRGKRPHAKNFIFRYLDENDKIVLFDNMKEYIKKDKIIRYSDKKIFNSYSEIQKDTSCDPTKTLSKSLKEKGIYYWNNDIYYLESIDISKIKIPTCKKKRSDSRKVKNLTTGETFESIRSAGSSQLMNKLRKGNGYCIYKKCEWEVIDKEKYYK